MAVQNTKRKDIVNFGKNIRFNAENYYTPECEEDLLEILNKHKDGKIKVIGSKHSWSDIFICEYALVDMSNFDSLNLRDGLVELGAGIQIKNILKRLHSISDCTLPSVGLITEQTIAGAISTATHGSGKNSLSHYVQAIKFAAYNNQSGKAEIFTINSGEELRAARCSIGCMGIIISVKLEVIKKYFLAESKGIFESISEALREEEQYPLQQTYLIPYYWKYVIQRRQVADADAYKPGIRLLIYRLYWLFCVDIAFHLVIKMINRISGNSNKLFSWFYGSLFPSLIINPKGIVDQSHRQLVMEHELFRHFEIEIFVVKSKLPETMLLVENLLKVAAGIEFKLTDDTVEQLKQINLYDRLDNLKGKHVHHYPICIRKILQDDAMMSSSASTEEAYYSISFICYRKDRKGFKLFADILAEASFKLFEARLHWGKYFPHSKAQVSSLYPELEKFKEICQKYDPSGVFQNRFASSIIFNADSSTKLQ